MSLYSFKGRGTYIEGFMNYIKLNCPDIRLNNYRDLNRHLKAIRLREEPGKPVSKYVERNSLHIQERYSWSKAVVPYFTEVQKDLEKLKF